MEKFLQEKASCWAHMIWKLELTESDGVVKLLIVAALEWELAT